MSLEQVTDVINGRRVVGSPSEILEVKNAFAAYSQLEHFKPYAIADFLKAHKRMMQSLVEEAGKFRSKGVGIYDGSKLIHAAPQAKFVRGHIENLFAWAKESDVHPLIKSAVVHYEIEFIHPFMEGNGRMGRLWQTILLSKWDALFASLPTETVILERQHDYYAALGASDQSGKSTVFIEFMLTAIADVLALQEKHKDKDEKSPLSESGLAVLSALAHTSLSRKELFAAIGMNPDFRAFKRNIAPLINAGYLEMTISDKPSSKLQKYRLTASVDRRESILPCWAHNSGSHEKRDAKTARRQCSCTARRSRQRFASINPAIKYTICCYRL
ncbi:Fic family protein [Betaproteobacteria bacterium]|nr:Fic family protein [Betaproteobacteria bacterium]GHU41560.1 Fic family protein [Betaproteobacteria bacterium]